MPPRGTPDGDVRGGPPAAARRKSKIAAEQAKMVQGQRFMELPAADTGACAARARTMTSVREERERTSGNKVNRD